MKKILLLLVFATLCLNAQEHQKQPSIAVSGEGIVKVTPDQVVINIRVEHTGNNAKEVNKKNDEAVNSVLQFCRRARIDKKDIHTQYMNLYKNYDYKEKKYNYRANQAIRILLRDIDRYETIIQGLLESGTNRIDGIAFKSSQIEKYKSEARREAVRNAKKKAMEYAGALEQSIGKAISISESTPPVVHRSMQVNELSSARADTGSTTIAIGEMEVKTLIQVVFELN